MLRRVIGELIYVFKSPCNAESDEFKKSVGALSWLGLYHGYQKQVYLKLMACWARRMIEDL